MPRPSYVSKSAEYKALCEASESVYENNDCSVKAVAIACGISYHDARELLAERGRSTRRGANTLMILDAVSSMGKKLNKVEMQDIIDQYPGIHSCLKSITTHHPSRFQNVWDNGKTYIAFTNGHVLAIKDGVAHDFTASKAIRVNYLYEVCDEN